jgi:hypothetical protein
MSGTRISFGSVSPDTLKAGINTHNPLANIHKFSIKTEEIKETVDVSSKEGLASSTKAKVVIIGAGKDGLPLILDTK